MNRREVWKPVKNFHLIKIYWIEMFFNIKINGDYKERLVALGCNQIPGKDFNESNSPVLHEVNINGRMAISISLDFWCE